MRLLVASDLHYTLPQLDWILDQSPDFDAVVLAGDLLDVSASVPLETQIVVIQTYLRKLAESTMAIVCSGNHDLTATNRHGEKAALWIEQVGASGALVDWHTLDADDVRITVCPWWDGPSTHADVDRQLERDALDRPRLWLWIYHSPPDAAPVSWTGQRHIGDTDLNRWITRHEPDLVLTGHIHDSPFRDGGSWRAEVGTTSVINAGRAPGLVPAHAIVDTVAGTAEWWSPYGGDTAALWPGDA